MAERPVQIEPTMFELHFFTTPLNMHERTGIV